MNARTIRSLLVLLLVAPPLAAGWKKPIPAYPAVSKASELREDPMPAAWGPNLPGHPLTGAMLTTWLGRFAIYPTRFDTQGRLRWRALRVEGPAGLGPYDHGLEVEIVALGRQGKDVARITAIREEPGMDRTHTWGVGDFMELPTGLNPEQPDLSLGPFLFQYRLSNREMFGFPAYAPGRVFFVARFGAAIWSRARAGTPSDLPASFNPEGPLPVEAAAWLRQAAVRLLALRKAQPAYQPLQVAWGGQTWEVVGPVRPGTRPQIEFWDASPGQGAVGNHPDCTLDFPDASNAGAAVLAPGGYPAHIRRASWDPATGRLEQLELEPWKPDALGFLTGTAPGSPAQAPIAQALNDALVDWKVKGLGAYLQSQDRASAEEFIARLEKTLLRMDLEIRKLRQAGDSRDRDTLNRQASESLQNLHPQEERRLFMLPAERLELGEDDGRTQPGAPLELLDVLDQRKAIISAILANAKQALATARR